MNYCNDPRFMSMKSWITTGNIVGAQFCYHEIPDKLDMVNLINSSVSKGNAILGLCKYLKINPDEAMAFGDDLNDISMINSVYGVAMGNAFDDLKTMAKEVVSTTNNESGISKILNRIVEERKQS